MPEPAERPADPDEHPLPSPGAAAPAPRDETPRPADGGPSATAPGGPLDPVPALPASLAPEAARVERVLLDELEGVDSPAVADRVAERLERLAGDQGEAERGDRAARAVAGQRDAADAVEGAATRAEARVDAERPTAPGTDRGAGPAVVDARRGAAATAAALTEAAAQAVAPTEHALAAAHAAAAVLPPGDAAPTPAARRGRRLLREALLRRMGPLQAIDTAVFLAVNRLPHPHAANVLADGITFATTGGWIWLIGLALARLNGVTDSRRAFRLAAPCIIGATSAVEWPIKSLFRRRRPFIDVVRALVVGRRPDGYSFPSGHTAAAFSGAWIVSTIWPTRAPIFFGLAGCVGFSRIYVGAHYPGDVLVGATLGMALAEAIRRPLRHVIR